MYFEEGYCKPSNNLEIPFLENEVAIGVAYHNAMNISNLLMESAFLEDGDEGAKKTGLIAKMRAAIHTICDKIINVINGFFEGLKNAFSKKEHIDVDAYLRSETGTIRFNQDVKQMEKDIDAEYLKARTIIQKISNVTKFDPAEVEELCDELNKMIHDHREGIKRTTGSIVKGTMAYNIAKKAQRRTEEAKEWAKQADDLADYIAKSNDPYLNANAAKEAKQDYAREEKVLKIKMQRGEMSKEEYKRAKKQIKSGKADLRDGARMRALAKASKPVGDFSQYAMYIAMQVYNDGGAAASNNSKKKRRR